MFDSPDLKWEEAKLGKVEIPSSFGLSVAVKFLTETPILTAIPGTSAEAGTQKPVDKGLAMYHSQKVRIAQVATRKDSLFFR